MQDLGFCVLGRRVSGLGVRVGSALLCSARRGFGLLSCPVRTPARDLQQLEDICNLIRPIISYMSS